jgi:hypothetical protein
VTVAQPLIELFTTTAPDELTPEAIAAQVAQLSEMGFPVITTAYPRKLHLGASIAGRIEPIGIKVDAAYQPEASAVVVPEGAGPLFGRSQRLPTVSSTLSFDYDRGSALSIVVEGNYTRVLDVPAGSGVYQLDGDELWLVATQLSWTPNKSKVNLRLLGFVDVSLGSYALRPAVRIIGGDHLSVELAAGLYGGPAASFGGVADRNDEIVLTVQYGL